MLHPMLYHLSLLYPQKIFSQVWLLPVDDVYVRTEKKKEKKVIVCTRKSAPLQLSTKIVCSFDFHYYLQAMSSSQADLSSHKPLLQRSV